MPPTTTQVRRRTLHWYHIIGIYLLLGLVLMLYHLFFQYKLKKSLGWTTAKRPLIVDLECLAKLTIGKNCDFPITVAIPFGEQFEDGNYMRVGYFGLDSSIHNYWLFHLASNQTERIAIKKFKIKGAPLHFQYKETSRFFKDILTLAYSMSTASTLMPFFVPCSNLLSLLLIGLWAVFATPFLAVDADGFKIYLFNVYQTKNSSFVNGMRPEKRQRLRWIYPKLSGEICTGEMHGRLFHLPCDFQKLFRVIMEQKVGKRIFIQTHMFGISLPKISKKWKFTRKKNDQKCVYLLVRNKTERFVPAIVDRWMENINKTA